MNIIKPLLISTTLLLSVNSFADENKYEAGEKIYKSVCIACHGMAGGMDMSKRIAPPIAAVRKHYIDVYPEKASFIEAVSSWIQKQDESKSLMRGAIRKFKIMPPLAVSKEDAEKVAAYIYSGKIEKPEGIDEHINEMHKKKGMNGQQHDMQKMAQHNMGQGMSMQRGKMMQQMQNSMRGRRGMNAMMMQQLNLSPEQKQKMQKLIQQKQKIMHPLKEQLQQLNQAVRQLDTTSSDYKQKVFAYADQKAKLVYRIAIEKGENRMNIESVLNPQQRAKFKQIRQNRFNK